MHQYIKTSATCLVRLGKYDNSGKWIQIEVTGNCMIRSGALESTVVNQGTESGAMNSDVHNRAEPEVVGEEIPPPPPETRSGWNAQ